MPFLARKKPLPWTELGVVALVALGVGWGITRQPLQGRPAEASPAASPVVASSALPPGSQPPPPPAPSEAQGCGYADRGLGDYEVLPVATGRLLARRAAVQEDGTYRLLVHFHGAEAVRLLLAPDAWDMNMLLVDGGDGSAAYRNLVSSTTIFDAMVAAADRSVSRHVGRDARAERLVLSSFSAGYGALAAVLASPAHRARIDGVVLLDSLHAPFAAGDGEEPDPASLAPFLTVAQAAREGSMFMGISHTAIEPSGYASTTETSKALLGSLGLAEEPVGWSGEGGLRPSSQLVHGRLAVRGYAGDTKEAHCAQLGLLPGFLHELMK